MIKIWTLYVILALSALGVALYQVELGRPAPKTYFVSYVYHCEENGPVAGYGYGVFQGPAQLDAGALKALQQEAATMEQSTRDAEEIKETIRSLSLISVQRL